MMQVLSDGLLFRGSRITGPAQHFLAVEFAAEPGEYSVRVYKEGSEVRDAAFRNRVNEAVQRVADELPVHDRYYLKTIFIDDRDRPETAAYAILLEAIIEEGKRKLPV